jgi:heme/copper-type cytochrome/quinol oxidase subunit 3
VSSAAAMPRSRPNGWWGMLMLVATEATLFAVLIASYFYLRFRAAQWPPAAEEEPKVLWPLVVNGILVSTSVPVFLAGAAVRRGRQGLLRLGLLAAFCLGAAYFVLQYWRFSESWRTFRPQDDAYASLVYTLVGAHWIHVGAGLLLLLWVQLRAWTGAFSAERHAPVEVTALYWYFMATLAVAVVATTLSPSL